MAKEAEIAVEQNLIYNDIAALNHDISEKEKRAKDLRKKFIQENEMLRQIRDASRAQDVRTNSILTIQNLEKLKVDHNVLRTELQNQDPNFVREQKFRSMSKQNFLDNQRLQEEKSLYSKSNKLLNQKVASHNRTKKIDYHRQGDIFDSIFNRQTHRQNVTSLFSPF